MNRQFRRRPVLFPALAMGSLLALSLSTGCSRPGEPASNANAREQEPHQVHLMKVRVEHLPVFIEASGSLLADETVTLSAKVAGRVVAVMRDLGDNVTPGQELATIDPTDYELAIREKTNAVDQALAQLGLSEMPPDGEVDTSKLPTVQRAAAQHDNARIRLERLAQLHSQKLVSDQDFNDAQTAAQIAKSEYDVAVLNAKAILAEARTRQSELATARQRLADTRVAAPRQRDQNKAGNSGGNSGGDRQYIVAQRMVSQGEYVSAGMPLFRLVDDNPIRLRMAIPERHSAQVKQGQQVMVRVQAFEEPFQGKVSRISPEVNVANRTFLVEVTIDNPEHRLKPGSFAMGSIQLSAQEPAILVPQEAVSTFAGVSKVFGVAQGKSQEVIVKLGEEHEGSVVVTQGLTAQSQIIHPLPARMVAGQPVVVTGDAPADKGS